MRIFYISDVNCTQRTDEEPGLEYAAKIMRVLMSIPKISPVIDANGGLASEHPQRKALIAKKGANIDQPNQKLMTLTFDQAAQKAVSA